MIGFVCFGDLMMLSIRHPSCTTPTGCKIIDHGSSSTCLAWQRIYDGGGNLLGRDPNIITTSFECMTCKRKWMKKVSYGEETIENL